MYTHPVTQKSLENLKAMGLRILETASGTLACGEEGWGKLLEPDLILKAALEALTQNPQTEPQTNTLKPISHLNQVKVLVTAGGTQEPIDTVRVISNLSSGRTGISIADTLAMIGFDVTLIQSHGSAKPQHLEHSDVFTTFASLDQASKKHLEIEEYTHIIHAAAVSDYSVDCLEIEGKKYHPLELKKMSSDAESMSIHLKRNHKIVDRLKDYSKNKKLNVIAFKLTSHANPEERKAAVEKLAKNSRADYVVHNDLTDIDIVHKTHKFTLVGPQGSTLCNSGDPPPDLIPIREHGMHMHVDVRRGQKTGLFLDQRDHRALVRRVARGRAVLNLFAYTGGFSLAAALGGATHVTTVDIARAAVAAARANFAANDLDPDAHAFIAADAFDHLEACAAADESFDLVIVDPPSIAPNQRSLRAALSAYTKLFAAALRQVRPGGLFAAASCSSHVSMEMFLQSVSEAARAGKV